MSGPRQPQFLYEILNTVSQDRAAIPGSGSITIVRIRNFTTGDPSVCENRKRADLLFKRRIASLQLGLVLEIHNKDDIGLRHHFSSKESCSVLRQGYSKLPRGGAGSRICNCSVDGMESCRRDGHGHTLLIGKLAKQGFRHRTPHNVAKTDEQESLSVTRYMNSQVGWKSQHGEGPELDIFSPGVWIRAPDDSLLLHDALRNEATQGSFDNWLLCFLRCWNHTGGACAMA